MSDERIKIADHIMDAGISSKVAEDIIDDLLYRFMDDDLNADDLIKKFDDHYVGSHFNEIEYLVGVLDKMSIPEMIDVLGKKSISEIIRKNVNLWDMANCLIEQDLLLVISDKDIVRKNGKGGVHILDFEYY